MRVVILHAYSSTNSGDGLLVEESIRLVRTAFANSEITVLALDPQSFSPVPGVTFIHPFTGKPESPTTGRLLIGAFGSALRGAKMPKAIRAMASAADLVVGVGGGYLRGSTIAECVKMLLAHYPQLDAARLNRSTIYLPQSIGPFSAPVQRLMARRLRRIRRIFLRDDRSIAQLKGSTNIVRAPDTALFALAEQPTQATVAGLDGAQHVRTATGRVGLVARALLSGSRRHAQYATNLRRLKDLTNATLLLQASARGNDDNGFYAQELGSESIETLAEATSHFDSSIDVVISVRLHGAIQSLRNGVPAIHLSYERKGWGAYQDLGLDEYVHNALDFDPVAVADQATRLRGQPDRYWAAVDEHRRSFADAEASVVDALRAAAR